MPGNSPAPAPKVGDRYQINEPAIGHGGMGVVYKAYDNRTRRYVALKTIVGDVDPSALELFEREWNVLARISHPNIVDILDTGEYAENGHRKPFFVMPLLPGATLEQLIKSSNLRLTVERTVEIMCQACRGLQAAHDQGLVHRDIKPSNIFVMDDDTVKIIDFGVVHLADVRTVTGLKGTPLYMSPEQVEGKSATALSDIFALGVVCYEALTGRKPFARRNEGELFEAIRTFVPPPASEINPAVNEGISRTVHKAMAKQPWHRFSSAREFSETLQKALRNQPIERFDRTKIQPRIERIKKAQTEGDYQFATEILTELESEGHMDPQMSMLRLQLDQTIRSKTIRQLLDTARTRMEEDEYPLALQKIQDVLNIDPENAEAATMRRQIERQRGEKQVENWFRLVAQHLDNNDYAQARQGLQEILKINSSDPRARELLSRVEHSEQELAKNREEKQKLYDAALASYRNGEISTALTKLERLMEIHRSGPKSNASEREAQYQSLYNQIRSEREAARSAYAEGRKYLADKNFAKALEICENFLGKQAGDPLFQALKIEAEEGQRQEQSAAIAEISRRVELEPDLDRKYNIIKEAVDKYPAEAQFKALFKLVKDRRELVNSILARARQYEERGQLNDAAAQWDILRNIYPGYPGLDFELQRLARRREDQVTEEAKAQWVARIDRHFEAGEYLKARETVKLALAQFPDDPEIRRLDGLAEQALKRSEEAAGLIQQGQKLIAAGQFEQGLKILRNAAGLDGRSAAGRAALIGALVQRARELMSSDWRAAEPLVNEVLELEPSDPVARSLTSLIADYKRQEAVSQLLLDARNLQGAGNLDGALAKVEEGLKTFPNESRLLQRQHSLRGALSDNRKQEAPVGMAAQAAAAGGDTLLMPASVPAAPPPVERPSTASKPEIPKPPPPSVSAAKQPTPDSPKRPEKRTTQLAIGAVVAAVILIGAALLLTRHGNKTDTDATKKHREIAHVPVTFTANVSGVRYRIDGAPVNGNQISLDAGSSHQVEAEADGFLSDTQNVAVQRNLTKPLSVAFNLRPAPPELHINSDLGSSGKLILDEGAPVNLQEGSFANNDVPAGSHHLRILDSSNREAFAFDFEVKPHELCTLAKPPKGLAAGVIVSSLGSNAIIYGTPNVKGGAEGQPLKNIPLDGEKLTIPSQGGLHYWVDDGKGKHQIAIDFLPVASLNVSLGAPPERIPLTVTANVPDATVILNGQETKLQLVNGSRTLRLPPNKYTVSVKTDDYEPVAEQPIELKSGDTKGQTLTFTLKRIEHMATLVIDGVPPDTEVFVDNVLFATVPASGTLTKQIAPTQHTITLKKANYVSEPQYFQQVPAGKTITITGSTALKPYGRLVAKVTPASAKITYQRNGDKQENTLPNNQEQPVPPGDYSVRAEAPGYTSDSQNVTVTSGNAADYAASLTPIKIIVDPPTPTKVFENGKSWTIDSEGWWVQEGKGISFTRQSEASFTFTLLRDPKSVLKGKVKRYEFVTDYRDEDNKVLYTLDSHHLTRKVYVDGKEDKQSKLEKPVNIPGSTYTLTVQVAPDTVTVKVGGLSEPLKRPDTHGRVGFVGETALIVR